MDYEKKYKEALARAREIHISKDEIKYLFPELKESEDEKKIKGSLMQYLWEKYHTDYCPIEPDMETCTKWINWLEKQGDYHKGFRDGYNSRIHEEKPLKWTKHDELVHKEAISCLKHWKNCIPTTWNEDYKNILIWLENELSVHTEKQSDKSQGKSALEAINEEKVDNQFCAKPVDKIVEEYNITGIHSKHAEGKLGEMIKNLKSVNEMKVEPKFKVKYAGSEYNVLEVKDIAGVTFYGIEDEPNHIDYIKAENCERVEDETEIPFGAKDSELQEVTYYIPKGFYAEIDDDKVVIKKGEKPTEWSEKHIADVFEKVGLAKIVREQSNDALTIALQDAMIELSKVTLQPNPTACSEEDEYCINQLIVFCENCMVQDNNAKKCASWLKSLKGRVGCEVNCTTTKKWSEEDIATISRVISIVKWAAYSDHSHPILNDEGANELVERLISLKERYTWKPSDAQMEVLNDIIAEGHLLNPIEKILKELQEQLIKLRGE